MKGLLIAYPQDITFASAYSSPTGEFVLDLYKNEPIPLQIKVDDFTKVDEKSSSNSKSFEIPGTKNNNVFFNHIYEITSDSGFNPHKKTKIIYKEDGYDIFSGYLQLNDIVIKNNNVSYDITLFSETTNLKESIGDKTLRDIDLSELNHAYQGTDIKNSWTGNLTYVNANSSGFRDGGTVKYPFVRYDVDVYYKPADQEIEVPDLKEVYRPWTNCRYLLKRILADAGYTYTSAFLDSTDFGKLYIDTTNPENTIAGQAKQETNNIDTSASITSSYSIVPFNNVDVNPFDTQKYNTTTHRFTSDVAGGSYGLWGCIVVDVTGSAATITRKITHTGTTPAGAWGIPSTQITTYNFGVGNHCVGAIGQVDLDTGEYLDIEIKATGGTVTYNATSSIEYMLYATNLNTIASINANLLGWRGDLSQWDFFSIFKNKFNLLVMSSDDNPNNLIIEPYNDYVDSGTTHDWTSKVDDREIRYTPITGLSRNIRFTHAVDENDYEVANTEGWNERADYIHLSDVELTDKDENKIEVKSSNTRILPLGQMKVPFIVCSDTDKKLWENKPRILYDNGVQTLASDRYSFGTMSASEDEYLQFSPVNAYPITSTDNSQYFAVYDYSEVSGGIVLNSLYYDYWDKYINELYHKDTRLAKVKAYITAKDLNEFSFNDIIMIKNKKFRVKMIDYKANSLSILELITIKDL